MNTDNINTATEFLAWSASLGPWQEWTGDQRTLRKKLFKKLSGEDRRLVQREGVEKFFLEENRLPNGVGTYASRDSVSPSGRYKLVQSGYGTHPGSWSYSRGEVFRVSDGVRVADVKRNYSSFPLTWMEDHHGHDYLICGEDYQGQTFCQLDTGIVKNHVPDEAFEGHGFCWATHELLPDGKTLLVDGCFWACPYEFRLYDVSNPMEGWPEIELPVSLDSERGSKLEMEGDTITWSGGERVFKETGERESVIEARRSEVYLKAVKAGDEEAKKAAALEGSALDEKYPDETEDAHRWGLVVDHRLVFRLADGKLTLVEEWKSEHKLEGDRRWEEYDQKSKEERRGWVSEDPLCAVLAEKLGGIDVLRGQTGFLYPSQNMKENGDKNPSYFQVSGRKYNPEVERNHSTTIGWGVVEGPVTVEIWVRGKGNVSKPEFPRTPEGIIQAWEASQAHLAAEEVK